MIRDSGFNKNFFARLIAHPSATRREKYVPVICFKQKRRIQNMELFLYSPVINYGHIYKAIEL